MPGWDKYTPGNTDDPQRLAKSVQLGGAKTTVGIFDMNGHYVGMNMSVLPQGRYIVRSRVQGRMVNAVYLKK
jgi:hypothetical protein